MKMVVLMCVEQYVDQARRILKDINIRAYSESEMQGMKNSEEDESDNWFAQKHLLANSHILFTIVNDEEAGKILSAIENNNRSNETVIHAFQVNIEKAVL